MCEGLMSNRARLNKRKTSNAEKATFSIHRCSLMNGSSTVRLFGEARLLLLGPSAHLDQKASDQLRSHCGVWFDTAIFTLYRNDSLNNSERLLI